MIKLEIDFKANIRKARDSFCETANKYSEKKKKDSIHREQLKHVINDKDGTVELSRLINMITIIINSNR